MSTMRSVDPEPGPVPLEVAYREHYRSLVRLASILVDDVGACEELVQEAFVNAWRTGGATDVAWLPAYLRSAVLNGARSHLRKVGVRRRHLRAVRDAMPSPSAEQQAVAEDETRRVLVALRSLPDRQREVLSLRYYLDLSEAEIADALRISKGSVKTHAHRGLAALEARLENER